MRAFASRAAAAPAMGASLLVQRCSCGSSGRAAGEMCEECREKEAAGLQAKLIVGAADDPWEREADAAARAVSADGAPSVTAGPVARVSRRASAAAGGTHEAPASVSRVVAAAGEPLGHAERAYFEPRFAHDFGNVRVHRDAAAAASAREVAARAYTVGSHVVFGGGRYAPESSGGRNLIAHELAHVIQQTGTVQRHTLAPNPVGRSSEGQDEADELQLPEEPETAEEAAEEPATETMAEEPGEDEAEAGARGVVQRRPLDGLQNDDEHGDPWPEKTEAAAVMAEMEASQKCIEETPKDRAECEPSAPLTWDDFQKKPPKSKYAGATWSSLKKRPTNTRLLKCMPKSAAAETAAPEGVQAYFVPAKSWVMKIYKDTGNAKLQPCKKIIGKCKAHFKKNSKKTGVWWAMGQGGCAASPAPRGDEARSSAECDTVVAKDCADSIVADSPRLLAHEQGHFDLTCAMAKKANALITKDTDVDKLINAAKKVLNKQQKKYDKETRHGCKPGEQSDWETAIAAGLPDVELKATKRRRRAPGRRR